ncbi:VanZ family protein [Aquincola sp. J276]|uniref:VanZ family protein n=1 Tax=Aquincola sp. J276 TaxID=2898432 RepID=UPI002151892F|nr:VanZ family protein [Aquincola sp. J276]MCR5866614.1 VanZ family protein [Aquincola sp. J276]
MPGQRSSAVPLAWAYALLIGYASLYPFGPWRWPPGVELTDLMQLPWPRWRDRFDEVANLLGYLPLGLLVYGAAVRSGARAWLAALLGLMLPAGLSFGMELTQNFLASRVPSLRDWVLNAGGGAIGVALGALGQRLGLDRRWQRTRQRWFVQQSAGAIALLLLWPVGLLFPQPLPLGVGQVGGRAAPVRAGRAGRHALGAGGRRLAGDHVRGTGAAVAAARRQCHRAGLAGAMPGGLCHHRARVAAGGAGAGRHCAGLQRHHAVHHAELRA